MQKPIRRCSGRLPDDQFMVGREAGTGDLSFKWLMIASIVAWPISVRGQ
jgi:hypothetical protein